MSDFLVSEHQIYCDALLSVYRFGDKYKACWTRRARKSGYEKAYDTYFGDDIGVGSESAPADDAKLSNNICRARSKIFEYAYCNDWDYFVTLTIDPNKYDRYDLKVFQKDLGRFLNNYSTHHGSKIRYVLIPEMHKDGAWHMHGLVSGILPKHLITNENGYLDFPMYRKKFGYCSLSSINSHEAVSKYITKYVTKELFSLPYGQNLYYCSHGLKGKELLYRFDNVSSDFTDWDFVHEDGFCMTKMFDNKETLDSALERMTLIEG